MRWVQNEMPGYFSNARTVVLGGRTTSAPSGVLREYTDNIDVRRPAAAARTCRPARLGPAARAGRRAVGLWPVRQAARGRAVADTVLPGRGSANRPGSRGRPQDCDVVVATYDELVGFGLDGPRTARRSSPRRSPTSGSPTSAAATSTWCVDTHPAALRRHRRRRPVLEAMMLATVRAPAAHRAAERRRPARDHRRRRPGAAAAPARTGRAARAGSRSSSTRCRSSSSRKVEPLGTITQASHRRRSSTWWRRRWPTRRRSPTATSPASPRRPAPRPRAGSSPWAARPKEMMAHSPEFTYDRLLAAAEIARKLGAQVMGLGRVHQGRRGCRGDGGEARPRCRSPRATATAPPGPCGRRTRRCERLGLARGRRRRASSGAAPWWSAPPGRSARCARGCWRWPATSCGWSRPRRPSCWRSSRTSSASTRAPMVHVAATPGEHLARHGRHRHRHLGGRQAGARHHGRQARLRDHRRRPPARPVGRGRREAPGRHRRGVRRDRAARATCRCATSACRRASCTPAWPRPSCWRSRAATRPSRWAATSSGRRSRRSTGSGLQARDAAGGDLRGQRRLHRRGLRPGARAGAGGPPERTARPRVATPAPDRRHDGAARPGRGDRGQRTSCPGCASVGMVPSRPAWKSSKACTSSSRVFMTNGPYAATGSRIGRPPST